MPNSCHANIGQIAHYYIHRVGPIKFTVEDIRNIVLITSCLFGFWFVFDVITDKVILPHDITNLTPRSSYAVLHLKFVLNLSGAIVISALLKDSPDCVF